MSAALFKGRIAFFSILALTATAIFCWQSYTRLSALPDLFVTVQFCLGLLLAQIYAAIIVDIGGGKLSENEETKNLITAIVVGLTAVVCISTYGSVNAAINHFDQPTIIEDLLKRTLRWLSM